MKSLASVFDEYEFLLPARFEGGYLILSLYEKIQQKELSEPFTTRDIKKVWEEISQRYHQPDPYGLESLIHKLGRYLIRDEPGQYGSYHLTQHAIELAEMLANRMNNPYKEYPLKQTIEQYFYIRHGDIKSFTDLDTKFGKLFVGSRLRVISGHLDALQDGLNTAYAELGAIIQSDSLSATEMVQKFVNVFRQFGERADDIRLSVATKDKFLESLRIEANKFYQKIEDEKHPETEAEMKAAERLKADWEKATEILSALTDFFREVDAIIERIRKQILYASDRLSELQYNLDSKSVFLLRIKRLLKLTLENAYCEGAEIRLNDVFPRKAVPIEKLRLFSPGHYDFALPIRNEVITQTVAKEYYEQQAEQVRKTVALEHRIRHWVNYYKGVLKQQGQIELHEAAQTILAEENNIDLVLNVGYELLQFARSEAGLDIDVVKELMPIPDYHLYVWNTKIRKLMTSAF